ncbi:MAG: iron-containing alcohol dehydrogenase [Ketobacter sp.]
MIANLFLPAHLKIGAGARHDIPSVLKQLNLSKPFLVSDPFMKSCGYLEELSQTLVRADISFGVFSDCVPDPTTDSVNEALAGWQQGNYDCIIALGGGSSIDTAKALSVLARHGGAMRDYKAPNPVPAGFPLIAIPTTAGTGSEATRATVITDTESQEKMLCMGFGFLPVAALVDFELTLSMPYRLTADTALDSLCHGMEAYVSRKANPFVDPIALSCISSIAANVGIACAEPHNRVAREALMLSATQGGIAFSNSSVTLIHGMSRPIGAFFHVPHGMSNAMLMCEITRYSIPGATSRYADCARAIGVAATAERDDKAAYRLLDRLIEICDQLDVPSPRQYGIDRDQYQQLIPTMAAQALASGSPNNNPVIPDQRAIEQIYETVYS